ncbi:hypothetical protein [Spirulina major]|uniref:hypothetical protein n=1 Tax=Spirulina major TaxID=270636 RepID=UPI00232EED55|nr:hypothetical protein [Spirulina major]
MSVDGIATISVVQTAELQKQLCTDRLSRNLTAKEWERYLDPNLTTYRRTCANLPAHPSVASRALELATSDPKQARNILQHLAKIDPNADLDPTTSEQETKIQVAIDNELARRKRDEGLAEAKNGDTKTATDLLTEAITLNPNTKERDQDIEAVIGAIQD